MPRKPKIDMEALAVPATDERGPLFPPAKPQGSPPISESPVSGHKVACTMKLDAGLYQRLLRYLVSAYVPGQPRPTQQVILVRALTEFLDREGA